MKTCTKCENTKSLIDFYSCKKGIYSQCKECIKQKTRKWNEENPERKRNMNHSWVISNVEKNRENARLWDLKQRKENPGLINAKVAKRRADKLLRTLSGMTKEHKEEIGKIYLLAKELSYLSDGGLHVDHIVPLKGRNVSGLHVPWNLQIVPAEYNLKKSNKY